MRSSPEALWTWPCTTFIRIPIILNLLTNRDIALIYSVTICEEKIKDCARSRSFQHYLQHRCFQLWCLPAFLTDKKPNYSCSFGFPTFWNQRRLTLDCFRRSSSPFCKRSLPSLRWLAIEVTSTALMHFNRVKNSKWNMPACIKNQKMRDESSCDIPEVFILWVNYCPLFFCVTLRKNVQIFTLIITYFRVTFNFKNLE